MPLVKPFYKAHYPSGRPSKSETIVVAYVENTLVASVRFKPIAPYWLMTGMLVAPQYRQLGIGHKLLQYCQQFLMNDGYYCFAYQHLEGFYQQHNFKTLGAEQLPAILATRIENYQAKGKSLIAMQYQGMQQS